LACASAQLVQSSAANISKAMIVFISTLPAWKYTVITHLIGKQVVNCGALIGDGPVSSRLIRRAAGLPGPFLPEPAV
jgi:hypothetical protein